MAASPPASSSLESSSSSFHEPGLSQLVEYLIASKRSLASTSLVLRARELVDSGRESLEVNAVLCARNTFVRHALDKQIESLEAIRYGTTVADAEGFEEFQGTLASLDTAAARLQQTLETLRSTVVEPSLRPVDDDPKALYDFVDDQGVAQLEESVKLGINRFEEARKRLAETCEAFEQELDILHERLEPDKSKEEEDVQIYSDETPVPALVVQLEDSATEIAKHLEGLVKHYDLCVTALKYTEGGGEAITQAASEEDTEPSALIGLGVDLGKVEDAPAPSISEEERLEMLSILVKDAAEVEEVVVELRNNVAEMEDSKTQIEAYVQGLQDTSVRLKDAMVFLKDVVGNLPVYISACAEFQAAWDEEKQFLLEKLEDMENLREFYSGFENAYDELLIEIQRRGQIRKKMDKVLDAASAELEELYQQDLDQRDNFRDTKADYIPNDLWPGLVSPPARFKIINEDEDAVDEIPDIKKAVFEKAAKRVKERTKPFKRV